MNGPDPVLGHFGPFRYCTKVDAKLVELVLLTHKSAKRCSVGKFRNERTRSTPLDPKLMFWGFSNYSITAPKVDAKLAELGAINAQVR
jgi:hypothetical protein